MEIMGAGWVFKDYRETVPFLSLWGLMVSFHCLSVSPSSSLQIIFFLLLDQHHKPENSSCLQALPILSAQASTSEENLCSLVSHLSGDSRLPTSQTVSFCSGVPRGWGTGSGTRLYGPNRSWG